MTVLDGYDLDRIRAMVRRTEDLDLAGIRDDQLQRRVTSFARRHGFGETDDLLTTLTRDPETRGQFVDAMTINVTSVYRNPQMWDALGSKLGSLGCRLVAWSAGCSIGAEPYSLAIAARRAQVDMRIIATDIDRSALAKAQEGRYGDAEIKETPREVIDEFFTEVEGGWRVDGRLKRHVVYRRQNLLHDPPPHEAPFDLILCRNVVIYFEEEAKRALHARFAGALKPNGLLFVGGAERVHNPRELGFELIDRAIYRYHPDLVRPD